MIGPATSDHGRLLQVSKPRRSFACIENFYALILRRDNKLPGQCRDARQMLQKIQRDALRFQNRSRQSTDLDDDVADVHLRAIGPNNFGVD